MEEILGADVARKAIADAMVRHCASSCGMLEEIRTTTMQETSFTRRKILPVNTAVSCSDCCIGAAGDVQRRVPAPPDPVAAAPDRHMPAPLSRQARAGLQYLSTTGHEQQLAGNWLRLQ